MKIKVYVNFETKEIVGEKTYKRMVAELLDEIMNPEEFNKYELFYMATERKPKVLVDFETYCREVAKSRLGLIEREVEIEV